MPGAGQWVPNGYGNSRGRGVLGTSPAPVTRPTTKEPFAVRNATRTFALMALYIVFGSALLACQAEADFEEDVPPAPEPSELPNIVFILADDLDTRSASHMSGLESLLVKEGTSFVNAFATYPLCCPSRASILRGQYPHNHQVLSNKPPLGGFQKFYELGHEGSTVATWLQSGVYRTVLIGKYLNGYPLGVEPIYVPPGWDEWYGYLGNGIVWNAQQLGDDYFNYFMNDNGEVVPYGSQAQDYQTDVLAGKATDYIRRVAESDRPFFMYLAPLAPHEPLTPAPRHKKAFAEEEAPRPPSFDEAEMDDKPAWVRGSPRLNSDEVSRIDDRYRKRLRMLLSVDEMISDLVEVLDASGELENTYIMFSSDNGYHQGEHRVSKGKFTAYEESIRVPLVVRGPGVPAGRTVEQPVLNIDFAPTFTEMGGVSAPDFVDGRSLAPLLTGDPPPANWRSAFLVEHYTNGSAAEKVPDYKAMRTEDHVYVEYSDGDRELYDLDADPYELESLHATADPSFVETLQSRLAALGGCAGASCRTAENEP